MSLKLNGLKSAEGAMTKKTRVGRGIGSGLGKTCGRGHKGQKARAGGYHKTGFEGGQMPLQRRSPKFGFISRKALFSSQIRLEQLNKFQFEGNILDLVALKQVGLVTKKTKFVKIFGAGQLNSPLIVKGISLSKSARAAVEASGGKLEEAV